VNVHGEPNLLQEVSEPPVLDEKREIPHPLKRVRNDAFLVDQQPGSLKRKKNLHAQIPST
jgi:hypothetical protein